MSPIEHADATVRMMAVALTHEPDAVRAAQDAMTALFEEHQDAGSSVWVVVALAALRGRIPEEHGTLEVRDYVRALPPSEAREKAILAIGVLIEVRIRDKFETDMGGYDDD